MKHAKRFTALLACLLAVVLMCTACSGKPKDVEAYLQDETVNSTVVSALESGMEQQSSVFEGIVDELQNEVQDAGVKVRIVYNNADGTEIYSCEFE